MAARPRQPVAKGGLWSPSKPQNVSKETTDLLKVMMEESKLTNFQRRQLQDSMKHGNALPVNCNPSSSKTRQTSSASKQKNPAKMNGRDLQYSGKRRKEIIDAVKDQESKEQYKPLPGKLITDKDKEKLQNLMAYGKDAPKLRQSVPRQRHPVDNNSDRFEEVMQEIEERRGFLEEMKSLGQGSKYQTVISTEISQKIRELEIIDKQRSEELEVELKRGEEEE